MAKLWFENALCVIEDGGEFDTRRLSIEIEAGVIRALHAPSLKVPSGFVAYDASDLLAVPGLINCHTHSPDNLTRGASPDLPLELWSLTSSAARSDRSEREVYISTLLGSIEMLRTGTTCVLDHVRISPDLSLDRLDAVAKAWLDSGMRVTIAPVVADKPIIETMPFHPDDLAGLDLSAYGAGPMLLLGEQLAIVEALYAKWHGAGDGRISVAIGPSGPQRCTADMMVRAADFARRHDTLAHSHVLETVLQKEMGFRLHREGMIAYLDGLGVLDEHLNLVHAVWLEPEDAARIAQRGASIIHNPVSNARLGSGVLPLAALSQAGVTIGLGTDSAACNDSNNLIETLKWAAISQNSLHDDPENWVGPYQALRLGTAGGAKALRQSTIGKLAVGMAADIAFFTLQSSAFVPLFDPIRQLVLSENGAGLHTSVINGRVVFEEGRFAHIAQADIWAEAHELVARHATEGGGHRAATHVLAKPIALMRARFGAHSIGGCSCH